MKALIDYLEYPNISIGNYDSSYYVAGCGKSIIVNTANENKNIAINIDNIANGVINIAPYGNIEISFMKSLAIPSLDNTTLNIITYLN